MSGEVFGALVVLILAVPGTLGGIAFARQHDDVPVLLSFLFGFLLYAVFAAVGYTLIAAIAWSVLTLLAALL